MRLFVPQIICNFSDLTLYGRLVNKRKRVQSFWILVLQKDVVNPMCGQSYLWRNILVDLWKFWRAEHFENGKLLNWTYYQAERIAKDNGKNAKDRPRKNYVGHLIGELGYRYYVGLKRLLQNRGSYKKLILQKKDCCKNRGVDNQSPGSLKSGTDQKSLMKQLNSFFEESENITRIYVQSRNSGIK